MKVMSINDQSEALEKMLKGSKNPLAKKVLQKVSGKYEEECSTLHMLFDEMLDQFKSGEMSLEEAVDSFAEVAKTIKSDSPSKEE